MTTLVEKSSEFTTVIKDLTSLEYDAIEAYRAAIERFESAEYRTKLGEFLTDHHNHVQDLKVLGAKYGVEVPTGPDAKQILTKGKVVLANLMGDSAILKAMKTNEDDTVTAYERASQMPQMPTDAKAIMDRGLADELRHRSWIEKASGDHEAKAAA